jgi:hypothetical protein
MMKTEDKFLESTSCVKDSGVEAAIVDKSFQQVPTKLLSTCQ